MHCLDISAYQELVSLHYLVGNLERCVFYAEEVIMLDPTNHSHYSRLGELLYGCKEYERAAQAYAHSLRLNSDEHNARAAYGLWVVGAEIAKTQRKGSSPTVGDTSETSGKHLRQWAVERLRRMYAGRATAAILEMMLQTS